MPLPSEFDKDRFEANMKLAQFGIDLWDSRRATEWRVAIGLWALLAGAVAIKEVKLPLWVGPVLFGGYVLLWLRPVWERNAHNRNFTRFYLTRAQDMLGEGPRRDKDIPVTLGSFLSDWSMLFQAITTGVLIIMVYVIKGW